MSHTGITPALVLAERYTIRRELGRGGMAVVYLADDARYGRPVAIKALHDDLSRTVGAERFLREIEIAARLQHPHILPLFDSGEHEGCLYYVMPFVNGPSLRDRLRDDVPLSPAEATSIALDVAGALAYSHERGVIHRDIKPENILLSKGVAVVADFGIARAVSAIGEGALTLSGMAVGTPVYMSPEQCLGECDLDGRSDLYALACVLYEMLAGVPPFVAADPMRLISQKLTVDPKPVGELRAGVPAPLQRVVAVGLARSRDDRFEDCGAFARELTQSLEWPSRQTLPPAATRDAVLSASDAPKLGPLASRTCNRWRQVNSFDAAFRDARQRFPGKPQFHVFPGPEGESHDSLITRLVATRLQHFAVELAGEERGTVRVVRIPWPESDRFDTRRQDLVISLFREISAGYMGEELTAAALSRQPGVASCPIVAVHHDVRSSTWDGDTANLLRWYLDDFWGALQPRDNGPLFVVFLKVIHDRAPSRSPLAFWRRRAEHREQQVVDGVLGQLAASNRRCPVHIATSLAPVAANDVKDWFAQLGLHTSEGRRNELVRTLFHDRQTRPMADVEPALEQVHKELVATFSLQRGVQA